jgi:hypothetical protein
VELCSDSHLFSSRWLVLCRPRRLNLWPLPRPLAADTKSMIFTVFCLHFIGTTSMFLVQYFTNHWIFSLQNYYDAEKGIDYVTSVRYDHQTLRYVDG